VIILNLIVTQLAEQVDWLDFYFYQKSNSCINSHKKADPTPSSLFPPPFYFVSLEANSFCCCWWWIGWLVVVFF
jgi:hypothetical protein